MKRRKKKKKSKVRMLQLTCEQIWKDICLKRDNRECQVKVAYPWFLNEHSNIIQVDHCFSRSCSELKFAPENGTCLCISCHFMKTHNIRSMHRLVDDLVNRREGLRFAEMKALSMRKGIFREYSQVWWLEEKIAELNEILNSMEIRRVYEHISSLYR